MSENKITFKKGDRVILKRGYPATTDDIPIAGTITVNWTLVDCHVKWDTGGSGFYKVQELEAAP